MAAEPQQPEPPATETAETNGVAEGAKRREAFAPGRREEIVVKWNGLINSEPVDEIKLRLNPITRYMRNHAVEEGALAYAQKNKGKQGFYITVAEKTFAIQRIHWWSLPGTVESLWDLLDPDLGDDITDAIGTKDIIKSMSRMMSGDGVRDAKNS